MYVKLTETTKQEIVTHYHRGTPVSTLCTQYEVPKSTLYHWIQQYRALKTTKDMSLNYSDYLKLKKHAEKLESQLAIIKAAGCGINAPLQEKLTALEALYGQYSVHSLCGALDVSRGTFYNHIFRKKEVTLYEKRREEMLEHVKNAFEESKQRYGAKKISMVLREKGIIISERYVAELMREMGLSCMAHNAKKEYTKRMGLTRKRQNLLQRQFNVTQPNKVWVSDVTCFKIKDKYYYTCVIIDLFSRKIIAHGTSPRNSTYLITSCFKRAYSSRSPVSELTFHSDRGSQYTSHSFQKLLQMNNVVQSFSKSGSPHDNAVAEAFFACMKKEELYRMNYKSEQEFYTSVDGYIHFYNNERPHGTLGYKTPDRFEQEYDEREDKVGQGVRKT